MFSLSYSHKENIHYDLTKNNLKTEGEIKGNYRSFSGPNVCLALLQMNFAGPQIYLQPAKIKCQHFGLSLKFLVCN